MADTKEIHEGSIPFFPDHVSTEAKVIAGVMVLAFIVGSLGMMLPVGTGEPADPMVTPAHVKPEWYFLALYQILKFVPKTLGVLIPIVGLVVVALWPFIDRKPNTGRAQRIRLVFSIVFLALVIVLTIWGEVS